YIVDPKIPAIGLVHSGRKGTELGVVTNAIRQMTERFGSHPANMIVQPPPPRKQSRATHPPHSPRRTTKSILPPKSASNAARSVYNTSTTPARALLVISVATTPIAPKKEKPAVCWP